jgi:ABC-2 type transport system ATP-binding protein
LARRHFPQTLIESVSSTGITVVMSSHLIGELARVCDHLVVIRDGRLCLAGELDELRSEHHWVSGPGDQTTRLATGVQVVSQSRHERHCRLLVRTKEPLLNAELTVDPVDLEEMVLAYLERPAMQPALAGGGAR